MLEGKAAVVTGAAGGIGAATARRLAEEGARVVVADLNGDGAETVAADIVGSGGEAVAVVVDVSDPDSVAAMIDRAVSAFGRLDVLHNNAAAFGADVIMRDVDVVDIDLDVWNRTLAVNLTGVLLGCRFGIPAILASGGGSIINTSSVAGWMAEPVRVGYGVSKAGIVLLTRHVATRYGKQGVRCNAIAPGVVVTDTTRGHMDQAFLDRMAAVHSAPRLGEPSDIADVACFLASDRSAFVNGHVLTVDGGLTAHLGGMEP
ncbi:MAG TPA: glucose 1-dehydrogenase [Acidimicrobiales bacterium]|nr:glucose 1-dehydrogenase [Acidimicrobiales bacterium]